MVITMYRNIYVEINVDTIKNNVKHIIQKHPEYQYYIGVVKGNAYGHGMKVCKWMIENGINYLATATIDEAIEIREEVDENIPILILQPVDLEYISICEKYNLTITISNYQYFQEMLQLDINHLNVHLKIDSGMNRLGVNKKEEVNTIYQQLMNHKSITLEGIYSHLATIGIEDDRFDQQVERFKTLTNEIDLNNIKMVHLFSSNAYVIHPKLDFCNGVRLGIILYGISPRNLNNVGFKNKLRAYKREYKRKKLHLSPIYDDFSVDVKPALTLCSEVNEIKEVAVNEYIGYGNRYQTKATGKFAIIPAGYMDGLSLRNSGRNVVINNKSYPIVGSVNMGMISVKIDDSVKLKDIVKLIEDIRAISVHVGTTPHQLLTSISPILERRYISQEGN